ncbi:FtsK/SpoIIIE family DNA translocase [Rudanella lutea]|uniref:FtsK/SpoIIIE family DNA translocase n=1 Tax=Rudanella lutea TaxID=451374 RepID=UPI00037065D3|nr:DNA translocase FtsK [Rudanella lutea]
MAQSTASPRQPANRRRSQTATASEPSFDWAAALDRWLTDQRSTLTLGVFMMLVAVGLFVAFISYLFNGTDDQSVVDAALDVSVRTNGQEAKNWLGLLGAHIGHVFIFRWFGIGALGLPLIVFLSGYKLAFNAEPLPLARTTKATLFGMLWISLFTGYFVLATDSVAEGSIWCGGIGYELNALLQSLLGWGSLALVVFLLFLFIVFFFNVTSLPWLRTLGQRSPSPDSGSDGTLDEYDEDENDEPAPVKPTSTNAPRASASAVVEEIPAGPTRPEPVQTEDVEPEPEPEPLRTRPEPVTSPVASVGTTLIVKNNAETGEEPPATTPVFDVDVAEEEIDLVATHGLYDPTLDLPSYQYPTAELLTDYPNKGKAQVSEVELEENKNKIEDTLLKFGIGIKKIFAEVGPTVTLYEIIPADGVRISKIKNLEDDIALSLAALGIRIIAPMPGKGTIGIEVPNKNREMVSIRSVLTSEKFTKANMDLPIVLGKTISNEIYLADLAKMPHLLMAGATGQGKSVGLNVLLTSLIYKKHPAQLKFVLVDPKKVELTLFNRIERHFLAKLPDTDEAIITDTKKVVNTLNSLCIEMDNRYNLLKDANCRNLKEYNVKFVNRRLNPEKGHRFLPYIVLVIDELADLMMTAGKEVEQPIARLAQLARAIGIHLVVATQRPSVNVITGLIKANFPARLSFKVTSKIDSRTILDAGGAEQLVGMGDMLLSSNSDIIRLQCPFVDTNEIEEVCDFVGNQRGYDDAYFLPEFVGDDGGNADDEREVDLENRDPMFEEAARMVVLHQQGSTSLIQRRLKLGYNRAGRIVDQLEAAGIVGPFTGSKARDVLFHDVQQLEEHLKRLGS